MQKIQKAFDKNIFQLFSSILGGVYLIEETVLSCTVPTRVQFGRFMCGLQPSSASFQSWIYDPGTARMVKSLRVQRNQGNVFQR